MTNQKPKTITIPRTERALIFENARRIGSALGTPFQNPVPLTAQDIHNELEMVRSYEDLVSAYKDVLLDLEARY